MTQLGVVAVVVDNYTFCAQFYKKYIYSYVYIIIFSTLHALPKIPLQIKFDLQNQ